MFGSTVECVVIEAHIGGGGTHDNDEPFGLPYTSVLSVIRLFPITSGSSAGRTFVQWSGHYSSDASAGK